MTEKTFGDARIEEFRMLANIEHSSPTALQPQEGPFRHMLVHIVHEKYVQDPSLDERPFSDYGFGGLPGESRLERDLNGAFLQLLLRSLNGESIDVRLTHRGRLRLAELPDLIKSGRQREKFGILWDGRHLDNDLRLAILNAADSHPLSLVMIDMNSLKTINDNYGHAKGDEALKVFFQAIVATIADKGEAYCVGGDEVTVLLPSHSAVEAFQVVTVVCKAIMRDQIPVEDQSGRVLSVSAGIVQTSNPDDSQSEIRDRADKLMYQAKEKVKARATDAGIACGIAYDERTELIEPD